MSKQSDDRDLWRRFAATSLSSPAPSALDLAAYADGTLDEAAMADIEAWLALNPDEMDSVLEARALRDVEPDELPVPLAAVRRARALITLPYIASPWQRRAGWVAVAASLILICIAELPVPARHSTAANARSEPLVIDLGVNVGVGAGDAGSLL